MAMRYVTRWMISGILLLAPWAWQGDAAQPSTLTILYTSNTNGQLEACD